MQGLLLGNNRSLQPMNGSSQELQQSAKISIVGELSCCIPWWQWDARPQNTHRIVSPAELSP